MLILAKNYYPYQKNKNDKKNKKKNPFLITKNNQN